MSIRIRRLSRMVAVLILGGALLLVAIQPAQAQQNQICGLAGAGYCMNDWNGHLNNNPVKMYYGNSSNENFQTVQIDPCNSNGVVTETCPFALGSGYNSALAGQPIFVVLYGNTGYCIGTTGVQAGGPTAVLTTCPDATGNGGGNGTIWVAFGGGGGYSGYAVTRYWANYIYYHAGEPCCAAIPVVFSGGNIGAPLFMASQDNSTKWGGPGWTIQSF